MTTTRRRVNTIKIYCPVAQDTLARLLQGDTRVLEQDALLGKMLAIVRAENPVGDFGIYKSVVEVGLGWEMFTPADNARPTLGAAGDPQISPTVILSVHVDANVPARVLDEVLDLLMDAHPWEVPVIEMSSSELIGRA